METLSKECYAYPDKNLYPIHTKQAALKSFKQFQGDSHKYSMDRIELIANGFIKAAQFHNIKFDIPEEQVQRQSVSFQTQQGGNITISKIASSKDVVSAVEQMQTMRQNVTLKQLRKVAKYIINECQLNDIQVQNQQALHKYAGLGIGDAEQMAQQFSKRGNLINMPSKCSSDFYALYRQLKEDKNQDLFTKSAAMCDLLDGIDRMYKLQSYYGSVLKRPEQVCFSQGLDSVIQQYQDYLKVDSTGTVLSKKALLQNKQQVNSFFDSHYGCTPESQADMFTKVAGLSDVGLRALIQEIK